MADTGQANGGAWGDFDSDGLVDLAVFRYTPRTDVLLYRNLGDGTFALEQERWEGVPERSLGGVFVDYDADGDLDLYSVHLQAHNLLFRNDGGRLVRLAPPDSVSRGLASLGAAFADFDGDGALDAWVVNRLAQGNRLLTRFYRPGFRDISGAFSLLRGGRDAFSVLPFDYDNDGDLDIHVSNRNAVDLLHRNDGGGVYRAAAAQAGVALAGASQAAFAGDYDNDGDFDLYIVNGDGQANALLRNDGGVFVSRGEPAGVAGGSTSSTAAAWADFDRDGWLDLLVSNGRQGLALYRNRGDGTFANLSATALPLAWGAEPPSVNGLALADYDNDGDIDVFAAGNGIADILLRNDTPDPGRWLGVELPGAQPGTRVRLRSAAGVQERQFLPRLALGSADGTLLHFGLGAEDVVDLEVRWPSGGRLTLRRPDVDQVLSVREPVQISDARISRVLAPDLALGLGPLAPELEIENIGRAPLDGAILEWQVHLGDELLHRSEQGVPRLEAGEKTRLHFAPWEPTAGEFRVRFDLRATGDPGVGDTWERVYHFHPFTEVAAEAGVDDGGPGWAAAWADYDNDGDLDLYVSNGGSAGTGENALYRNDGGGFTDVTVPSGSGDGGNGTGVAFADWDNDGDQDLLVVKGGFFPEGEANRFLLNNGDGTFADGTASAGLGESRSSYGAAVGDWDNDGYLDLYITQFRSQFNRLYRNDGGGGFVDVTGEKEIRSSNFSSGAAGIFSDYDNDGRVELYASFYGSLNVRYSGLDDGSNRAEVLGDDGDNVGLALADYDGDGYLDLYAVNESGRNVLYRNVGDGSFVDVGAESGTENIAPGTGAAWGDYDNDGDEDLFAVNGAGANRVFMNRGDGSFVDVASGLGFVGGVLARAAVVGDYDGDGDLDAYVVNEGTANRLYRNQGGGTWLQAGLHGSESNADGVGARVRVFVDGRVQTREVNGAAGLSQNSRTLHFGLGGAAAVDSLQVSWPSGREESRHGVVVGRRLLLVEGGGSTVVGAGPEVQRWALGQNVPNPFNATTHVDFSMADAGSAWLGVYNALGQRVRVLVDGPLAAGAHRAVWDARDGSGRAAASGVYFYRLEVGGLRFSRSMLLVR